ncbi:MAG TPA: phosphatase PAP2 family protein [Candidatus Thermoplasmatota archaeon]|nr:phosphatase PAP2 family protein [Candidatus Thermoplasmatota archaeon]
MATADALGLLRIAFAALVLLALAAAAAATWRWGHVPHMRRWFALGVLGGLAFLGVAGAVVAGEGLAEEDLEAVQLAALLPAPAVQLARALGVAGSAAVMAPLVAVTCVALWRRGQRGEGVRLAVAMAATPALVVLLKVAFARERPEEAVEALASESFPSGHAAAAAALGTWLVRRAAEHFRFRPAAVLPVLLALLWVAVMGASRVALRVHYVSDVLGGAAFGVCVAAFTFSASMPQALRKAHAGPVDDATVS